MSSPGASRRTALLVGVVVCVALSGVAVVPTSGAAAVETGEAYVVSGGYMQVSSQSTFGFDAGTSDLGRGDIFNRTLTADDSTAQLEFTNWRHDDFDEPDYGVDLRLNGPSSNISDPNGDSFRFVSFTTEVYCSPPASFDVVGYEDGQVVGVKNYSINPGTQTATVRSVEFASVDEVRFENYQIGDDYGCLKIDDIVVGAAVSGNDAPQFSNLDAAVTYDEDGTPVLLDGDATVSDTELDAAGDYAESTLTVARASGADADDSFGFDTSAGTFAVSGSELTSGGNTFATFSQSGGTLTVDFTSSETTATPALVDDVLQAVTYETAGRPEVFEYEVSVNFNDGDPSGSLSSSETVPVTYDPALDPITTQTTLDFSGLSPELSDGDDIEGEIFQEVLFYGFQFGDAAEESEVPSNEFQFNEGEGSADPSATGIRFETDEAFRLDAIDIDNYDINDAQNVTVHGYLDGTLVGSASYNFSAESGYQTKDIDADDAAFEEVDEVRFTSTKSDKVAIDNIVLDATNQPPTVDLDTGAAGTESSVTFSELDDQGTASGDGVAVTGPVDLSDSDGTVSTATVTLDNPQGDTGEGLALDTSGLASSLGFSTSTSEITITRNTATEAELAAAIEAVRFQNDADAPDTTDRTVTVTATDDAGATASASATVSVQPGNDGPSITAPGGTLQPTEDAAFDLSGANEIQVSDVDDGGALMSLTLAADNGTLTFGSTTGLAFDSGTNGASSFTVSGTQTDINNALATLDYQGDTDYNGADTVTATVSDEGNTGTDPGLTGDGSEEIDTTTVSLDVQPVPDAPTISAIADQSTDEDQPLTGVAVTVDDAETDAGSLTLSFSSDTPALVQSHTFGGSGTDRTLDITPAADQSGSTIITVTVSDGSLTAQEEFLLTINAVNDQPTITPVSDLTVDEDSDVSPVAFSVEDVETAPGALTVTASSDDQSLVPDGNLAVSGTGADRTLDITLAPDATGTATITLEADEGGVSGTESFTLTVDPVNDPPAIATPANETVEEDSPYSVTPTVTDVDSGDTATFSVSNAPDWTTLDTATGELSGTPENAGVGNYDGIRITVEDSGGATATTEPFSVDVENTNDAPSIPTPTDVTATEDSPFSFTPAASDVDVGDTLTYSASGLPSWASFDTSTGEITGVPTNSDVGTVSGVEITVTDAAGATATTDPFGITVENTNDEPTISTPPDATVDEDSPYSFTPTASDVDVGDSLTYSASGLPSWVSIDAVTGELSATPENADVGTTSGIEITVTDSAGATATTDRFNITVENTNDAPTIAGTAPDATEDSTYSFTPTATDVDPGDSLTYSASGLPAWAEFDTATGELSGTPTNADVGTYSGIEITVTDEAGESATLGPVAITVENTNDAPTADADSYIVDEDTTLSVGAPGVLDGDDDIDGDTLSATVVSGPDDGVLTLDADGSFDYVPDADFSGTDGFTYAAADGNGATAQAAVSITVEPVDDPPTVASIDDLTVDEDADATVTVEVADPDTSAADLSVRASADGAVIGTDGLVLGGRGATRQLAITPRADRVGTATVTVTVDDGTASRSTRFDVTVRPVNDPPSVSVGGDQTVTNDTGEQTVDDFATDFAPGGGADESGQSVADFDVTVVSDPADVLAGVDVTDDGTLTYAASAGVEGTATVAVRVRDDGGTDNGGADTSAASEFDITVDTRAPTVTGARTGQATLTLTTDEALATTAVPGDGDFTVTAGNETVPVTDVAVDGRNLTLALAGDIEAEDSVTLDYAPGNSVPQDAGGNRLAGFTGLPVTNTVPNAVPDGYTVSEDNVLSVGAELGVLANDTDDAGGLTATVLTNATNGTLRLAANGSFEYRPDRDYNGADAFTYELRDADGNTDTARVNITVLPVRDGGGGGGGGGPSSGGSADTRVRVTDSEDGSGVDASVSRARAGQPVGIALGSADGGARNIDVANLDMTVERDSSFALSVTTSEVRADGAGASAPTDGDREFAAMTGATPIGRVAVDHTIDDADIGEVTFTFRVRKDYLGEIGVDPSSVALYRDETTRWNRLPTRVVGETGTHYVFQSTSPGLSVFTVGTNASMVSVTDARLRTGTVGVGQSAPVVVTLANRGAVERAYDVELTADGRVVAAQTVDVAAGANRTVTLEPAFDSTGTYALAVDGRSAGEVTVRSEAVTTAEPTEPTTTGGSGPGMGVVAALVAVALVALRARKQR